MGNCLGKISTIARRNIAEASDAAELEWEGTGEIVTPNLKVLGLDELKSATRNFRPDTVLGEGGFGRVFKGMDRPEHPQALQNWRRNPRCRQEIQSPQSSGLGRMAERGGIVRQVLSSKSGEADRVLHGGESVDVGVRIHAKGELGKPPVRK